MIHFKDHAKAFDLLLLEQSLKSIRQNSLSRPIVFGVKLKTCICTCVIITTSIDVFFHHVIITTFVQVSLLRPLEKYLGEINHFDVQQKPYSFISLPIYFTFLHITLQ